jgi:hypothetical protein
VDLTATLDAPCGPEDLFAWVDDLGRYPAWLTIVARAEPVSPSTDAAGAPAWEVDLRGRLGPLARSKRLRMERTVLEPGRRAAFERRERDGRHHADWALFADVETRPDGRSRLTMRLHYGGGLWGPVLERLLRDEIEEAKPRLLALVTAGA